MHSVPPNSVVLYEEGRVNIMSKRDRSGPVLDYQI
jgi:hypothetical protein